MNVDSSHEQVQYIPTIVLTHVQFYFTFVMYL